MQASIRRSKNIRIALQYNERKVSQGRAERIKAENFLKEHNALTRSEITERFQQRLPDHRYQDRGYHFSLNFGEREILTDEKIIGIAGHYMANMGFDDQPYLVYRHYDAGHTHVHVVASAVLPTGALINLMRGEYRESQAICRNLEKEYALEKNPMALKLSDKDDFAVEHAQKVTYGNRGLKHSISDVLNTVVDHYNYTSLDEFNAVLSQYGVTANPGTDGSWLREKGGLLYHALDENGKHIGIPIKASSFLLKPTLKNLQQKFEENQLQREGLEGRLYTAIEWALAGRTPDWKDFTENLEKEGIALAFVKERVFFVDHTGKASFEGSALGYPIDTLRSRCVPGEETAQEQVLKPQLRQHL